VTAPEAVGRHGFHRLVVERIVEETADTSSFVLAVPDDLADAFRYRPGQFCTVRVRIGDGDHLRSYSMSSAAEVGDPFTLTIKRVPEGLVSNWLLDHVGVGHELQLTRPAGVFCPRDGDAPMLGFCGGSGVTPVISIAKHVLATTERPVRLLYANRHADSVIFDATLADLAERHPGRLEVRHHLDVDAGYLDAAAVTEFVGEDLGADHYICGPAPFMDLVEATLVGEGVPADRISIERFVNAHELAALDESGHEESAAADDGGDVPSVVTIILKGKRHEVSYQAGDTLLNTARRGGLSAPFSCEAGNCATCMAMLHEGTATMRTNNALDDDEVAEGWILTCQAVPHGAVVTVEYENL
jgi:ferredoxin-NADP reductase